jgi:hypothetical protein
MRSEKYHYPRKQNPREAVAITGGLENLLTLVF